MKKKILIGLGIVGILAVAAFIFVSQGAKKSPRETTSFKHDGLDITVAYGRPFKRGRLIFGQEEDKALQPYGKYWRMGANAVTAITFSKNVNFGGKPVNAGSYRMYAIPGATVWQIGLNSEYDVYFGATEPDYSKDIAKIEVPAETTDKETDQFTISFQTDSAAVSMNLMWDKVLVKVPITIQ